MFIPIRIAFENFLSFKDYSEFKFQHQGIHFIYGIDYDIDVDPEFVSDQYNVGVGKSSLTLSIQYALYGKIQKNIKMDRIINKATGKNLFVEFDFMMSNTLDEYRIQRYRKHDVHKNNLYLLKKIKNEWVEVGSIDKDATQDEINKLIVLEIRTFEKSVLFTREDKTQFLELNTLERGSIFENISQLSKLRAHGMKVYKKLKEIEEQLEQVNQEVLTKATIIRRDKQYINELYNVAEEKKKTLKEEIQILEEKLHNISSCNESIDDVITKIESLKNIKNTIDNIAKEQIKVNSNIEDIQTDIDINKKEIARYIDVLEKNKKIYDDHKPIKCHECGAIQNQGNYEIEHQKLYETLIQRVEEQKTRQNNELLTNIKRFTTAKLEYQKLEESMISACKNKDDIVISNEIKDEIFNGEDVLIGNISELNEDLKSAKHKLDAIDPSLEVARLNIEIEKTKTELQEYEANHQRILRQKNIFEFWSNALDFKTENSIKQYVISTIIPLFNYTLQKVVDAVYKGDLVISFDNFFTETIIYHGEDYQYDELSTGEKTKLNFCISLAIFDLTRINLDGCNVIFMDEIFNNVDLPTIIIFLDIIREKYANNNGIYIISHLLEVKENLNPQSITRIEKRDKCSKIFIE